MKARERGRGRGGEEGTRRPDEKRDEGQSASWRYIEAEKKENVG